MTRAWYFSTLFFIFIAVGIVEPFTVFILKFCLPASAYAKLRWMRDPTLFDDPARVRLFVEPAALLPDDVAACFGALGADAPARLAARDPAEALRWVRAAAEQGHVKAQSQLSYMHFFGIGTAKDAVAAAEWSLAAAEAGDAVSQRLLATFYRNGTGVPRDIAESVFEKITWMGFIFNVNAFNKIGQAYRSIFLL